MEEGEEENQLIERMKKLSAPGSDEEDEGWWLGLEGFLRKGNCVLSKGSWTLLFSLPLPPRLLGFKPEKSETLQEQIFIYLKYLYATCFKPS